MTAIMTIMEDFLKWRKYKYLRLDGTTKVEIKNCCDSILLKFACFWLIFLIHFFYDSLKIGQNY